MTKRIETTIELKNNRVLSIYTRKFDLPQLETVASVGTRDGAFVSHALFTDYYKKIQVTPCKRVTQKALETEHSRVVQEFKDWIRADVTLFYGVENV